MLVYTATIVPPDRRKYFSPKISSCWEGDFPISCTDTANILLYFNEETGKLEKAEVIK